MAHNQPFIFCSEEPIPRQQLEEWAQKGIDGLYCLLTDKIDKDVVKKCGPNLKVVSTMSAGFNHIDVQTCKEKGVAVGFTPDVLTDTTADLAVGLLLSTARRIPEAAAAVQNGMLSTTSHREREKVAPYPTQWYATLIRV